MNTFFWQITLTGFSRCLALLPTQLALLIVTHIVYLVDSINMRPAIITPSLPQSLQYPDVARGNSSKSWTCPGSRQE